MTYKTLPRPPKANKQVQEYLSAVSRGTNGRYVIPNGKGWYVRKPNSQKGTLYATKTEAITQAERELKETKGQLFVFDKNGQLTENK